MKSLPLLILLVLAVSTLLLVGGCSKHFVDIYVNEACDFVTLENDKIIDPLLVFKGDYVIFNNLQSTEVELNLPDGVFETDDVVIAGGKRVILRVIMNGPAIKGANIECTTGSGSPKVRVGEEP